MAYSSRRNLGNSALSSRISCRVTISYKDDNQYLNFSTLSRHYSTKLPKRCCQGINQLFLNSNGTKEPEHTCVRKYKADLSGISTRNSESYKQCSLWSIINRTKSTFLVNLSDLQTILGLPHRSPDELLTTFD